MWENKKGGKSLSNLELQKKEIIGDNRLNKVKGGKNNKGKGGRWCGGIIPQ